MHPTSSLKYTLSLVFRICFLLQKMFTVVWLFIATTVAGGVAGSKLEATEGQNVSLLFKTGLERVDEVKIMFEGESKRKRLLAQYCSPDNFPICDPLETSQLQVEEGNVSFILVKVNISRSGLYTAQVITDNRVYEVNHTLVVNQAPVSSSPAPPHSSSSPNPLHSSQLLWLYALIPLVIVVSGGVYFWKLKRKYQRMKKLLPSPDPESQPKTRIGKTIAVVV